MNKDLLILMQNSMAHATNIHIANKDGKINTQDVIKTAKEIATAIVEVAGAKKEDTVRKPGQPRR